MGVDKYRILTISTTGLGIKDGISTVVYDYYSLFDKTKFELDIVAHTAYDKEFIASFERIGCHIHYLPSRRLNLLKYIVALIKLFRERNYNAIYVHGSSSTMVIELILAKIHGCKTRVVHSHNTTCDYNKMDVFFRPIFYHLYTLALACGNAAGKWLYGKGEFEIIKNGREIETYRFKTAVRERIRTSLGLCENVYAIGHVGNFNEQKNQDFLVGIFQELKKSEPNVKLFFMGEGHLRKSVAEHVAELGLENDVVFTGSISNVPDMLQAMDVMVLPSYYEGLPLVAVEWQIAALPSVLSDSITKECAYTDLVHFCSLSDTKEIWAKEILKYKNFDRQAVADKCVELTRESGFVLQENAERLQAIFFESNN